MAARYYVVLFCLLVLFGNRGCKSEIYTTSTSSPPTTALPVEKGGCGGTTPQKVVLLLPCLLVFYQNRHSA